MSLARAFTTRRNKLDIDTMFTMHLGRHGSQRNAGGHNSGNSGNHKSGRRPDISGPVELISTSNNTLYDSASHIAGTSRIPLRGEEATPTKQRSLDNLSSPEGEESDDNSSSRSATTPFSSTSSTSSSRTSHDRATITDISSADASPISPPIEPNHLSCYFNPVVDTTSTQHSTPSRAHAKSPSLASNHAPAPVAGEAPLVPKRMPSHSKRAHEHVYKKRSIQRSLSLTRSSDSSGATTSRWMPASFVTGITTSSSATTSSSIPAPPATIAEVHSPSADMTHENPFEHELLQVDEVVEDYAHSAIPTMGAPHDEAVSSESDEDDWEVQDLHAKGLGVFGSWEYQGLVEPMVRIYFDDHASDLDDGPGDDESIVEGKDAEALGWRGRRMEAMQWL